MTKTFARTTVTAALPYANGPIHIGHLAGCYLPADTYVRYLRLMGEEVLFICGSDEHGVAITIKARAEGTTPRALVDHYHAQMKETFDAFGVEFDWYGRTSSPTHHAVASEFFETIYKKGNALVQKETDQYFDAVVGQFLADRYIEGTCPVCSYEHAYGDQCERCGSTLSPIDLINPVSKLTGTKPELRKTSHWFLALDTYTDWLKSYILDAHASDWKTNVIGQCRSWLEAGEGLQPRSMTRDMDWGVAVPSEIPGSAGKVLYVWFDAPIGYISATKEWAQANSANWEPWWKAPDTRLVHFIGKDNIVFHCIIFPAILKAHGDYIFPDQVPANEFLNLEGKKISTSRNWAVWLHEYLTDFPGMQDVLRYVLTATAPETKDNDFTWKEFQQRNNAELVAVLGNFINRIMVLTHKYFEGKVPVAHKSAIEQDKDVQHLYEESDSAIRNLDQSIRQYRFREALGEWMQLARLGNKFLTDREPWKKFKPGEQNEEVGAVLTICLELAAQIAWYGRVFVPHASENLHQMLGIAPTALPYRLAECPVYQHGHLIGQPTLLFRKIEDSEIEHQIAKLNKMGTHDAPPADSGKEEIYKQQKPAIPFEQFTGLDLRIARILAAEAVPKTDKLLKITLDAGEAQPRTVVSGIALAYKPEDIIGKSVLLLANLEPRTIKGIESKGMLLLAEGSEGKLSFVTPEREVPPGAGVA
jgi:methionyl-tRNA synthetase